MRIPITAISRHGALANARRALPPRAIAPLRQGASVVVGSSIIAVAVSLLIHARLGLAPYDVLISAIAEHTGLPMGQAALILTSSFFALAWRLGRPPSAVSLAFMVSVTIALDIAIPAIGDFNPLGVRIAAIPIAIALLTLGIAIVVQSTDTGGAFELIMRAMADRGMNPTIVRAFLEISSLIVGIIGGGSFGFATVVVAITIAPSLQFWMTRTKYLAPRTSTRRVLTTTVGA